MQFAVQDIRRWGNRKLCSYFYESNESRNAFIERMRIKNMMLSDIKSSAYSLPKVYGDLHSRIDNVYVGMVRFVDICEPLILSIDKMQQYSVSSEISGIHFGSVLNEILVYHMIMY